MIDRNALQAFLSDPYALGAVLRGDFQSFLHRSVLTLNPGSDFLPNWHIDAIAYQLDRVRRGEITRLVINLPPRNLKSIMSSVAFPAFILGHDPRRRVICISYGADLAEEHAKNCLAVMQSDWYRAAFPGTRILRPSATDIRTSMRGFRKATSVGGALTGFGGDLFIIDDPQKPVDVQSQSLRDQLNQWFSNTLISRLDSKELGAIVIVMQRVHLHDLTGYLQESSGGWTVLDLAAIAEADERIAIGNGQFHFRRAGEALHPRHESLETLNSIRREMGFHFDAQYQQSPVPPGGAMIRREWLCYYDVLPERTYDMDVIQSWDCASKDGAQNSWSVCTTWLVVNKRDYYLIDLTRGRYEYPRLRETALALAERYKPTTILIEDASTGLALAQELKNAGRYCVEAVPVTRDKATRLYVQTHRFEAGHIFLPRWAAFMADLLAELLTFPQSKHDDQVDSITQALAYEITGYDTTMKWARHL
jgi:predicted phage terminase large subunit-like protein